MYQGKRSRFVYLAVEDPPPKVAGMVKLDLRKGGGDCVVVARMYGRGRYGGEPVFVPAREEGDGEDDGYLVTYLHDEITKESSFLVMDARSPELEVVTEISLPSAYRKASRASFSLQKKFTGREEEAPR